MKRKGFIYEKIVELDNIESAIYKDELNFKDASAMLSYSGWLKHCDSFNYQQKYIKPYIDYKKCKEVVRNESKKYNSSRKIQNR